MTGLSARPSKPAAAAPAAWSEPGISGAAFLGRRLMGTCAPRAVREALGGLAAHLVVDRPLLRRRQRPGARARTPRAGAVKGVTKADRSAKSAQCAHPLHSPQH